MWNTLKHRLRPAFAVDLGSNRTRVLRGGRVLVDEPSVIAVERAGRRVSGRRVAGGGAAVGRLAERLVGRTPDAVEVVRPVREGVVTDFDLCGAMLRQFFARAVPGGPSGRPSVVLTVPGGVTPVERRAAAGALARAGAGTVILLDAARAAAVGAALPVAEPLASLVCVVGGGTTEIAALSAGDVIAGRSLRTAGDAMDRAVVDYLRDRHTLRIGDRTAARIKREVGSAAPLETELECEAGGLDAVARSPRTAVVTSEDVRAALAEPLGQIARAVAEVIDRCGPELVSDLTGHGLLLAGGGARLRNLGRFLEDRLNLPVRLADDPDRCVIRGAGVCGENRGRWGNWLEPVGRAA